MPDPVPDPAVARVEQAGQDDQHDHDGQAHALALFHLRVRGPLQEGGDVLGFLAQRGLGAVVESDPVVDQRRRHGDEAADRNLMRIAVPARSHVAGHIGVVVLAVGDRQAGGRVRAVAGHDRIDVARSALAGLGQQGHVRRQGSAIGRARRLRIGERIGEIIGAGARPLDRVAGVGIDVRVLDVLRERLHHRIVVRVGVLGIPERPARIAQVAEGDEVHRVAGGTDLLVDLVAALELLLVVVAERALERPVDILQRRLSAGRQSRRRGREQAAGQGEGGKRPYDRHRGPHSAAIGTARPA